MTRLTRLYTTPSEGVCMVLSFVLFAAIAAGVLNPPAARAALMTALLGAADIAARILGV